jgi:hypothetical protein
VRSAQTDPALDGAENVGLMRKLVSDYDNLLSDSLPRVVVPVHLRAGTCSVVVGGVKGKRERVVNLA